MYESYQKTEETWVPVPYAAERTEGRISAGWLGLPNAFDVEQLELNVGLLDQALIGWGGFRSLQLGAFKGDKDQVNVSLDANADGAATMAGSASATKAESSNGEIENDGHRPLYLRQNDLSIRWNYEALNNRLEPHEQYDPAIRAEQLSRVIKKEAIKSVVYENMFNAWNTSHPFYKVLTGLYDAMQISVLSLSANTESSSVPEELVDMITVIQLYRMIFAFTNNVRFTDVALDVATISIRPGRAIGGAALLSSGQILRPVNVQES